MEWKKHWAKQKMEWAREDIKFYEDSVKTYRRLCKKHCEKKHDGNFEKDCETCRLFKEVADGAKDLVIKSKKEIQEVLRGER